MGRYGIGARVRDDDGDTGVIVGKPAKGFRTVEYDTDLGFSPGFSMDRRKSDLTPVEGWQAFGGKIEGLGSVIDFKEASFTLVSDDCCAEKGEVAFKVGVRVRYNDG